MRQFWYGSDCHFNVHPFGAGVEQTEQAERPPLTAEGYRITVDDGRESFYALSLTEADNDAAWLMSDTVRSLAEMR